MHGMHGFSHLRKRVRVSKGLEPFPARSFFKRLLDNMMYAVALVAPLALLPQIIQIYSTKSGAGVSIVTWVLLMCVNVLWFIYGAVHKDKHLLIANGLLFLFDMTIVVGLVLYR